MFRRAGRLARSVLLSASMSTAQRLALVTDSPPTPSAPASAPTQRFHGGWRSGRPIEDPAKTKRWGFITAKPSEYLIHVRGGRIRRRSTGQGASCFKWPWDSVAVIPTTISRLQFTADQVTVEKVGVQVTGLAVYRIVEPEIAYRMLNFSYAERASEKLASILREMFEGATRRHIANLSVEDVMTRRKDAIAETLLAELAPVMRGHGQAHDSTERGWGVVLDTVEVQNVRILSEAVFRDMQATYRSQLALAARQAELASERDIAVREAESKRRIEEVRLQAEVAGEEAKLAAETNARERKAKAESRASEIELSETGRREALEAQARAARLQRSQEHDISELRAEAEIERERAEREEKSRLAALAREQTLAEAERQVREAQHQNRARALEMRASLQQQQAESEMAAREAESAAAELVRQRELELERLAGELEAHLASLQKDIDNQVSEDRIRMTLVERSLPALAQAFAQQFAEVKLTHIGGSIDPGSMVAGSIAHVLGLARSLGVGLGAEAHNKDHDKDDGRAAASPGAKAAPERQHDDA